MNSLLEQKQKYTKTIKLKINTEHVREKLFGPLPISELQNYPSEVLYVWTGPLQMEACSMGPESLRFHQQNTIHMLLPLLHGERTIFADSLLPYNHQQASPEGWSGAPLEMEWVGG